MKTIITSLSDYQNLNSIYLNQWKIDQYDYDNLSIIFDTYQQYTLPPKETLFASSSKTFTGIGPSHTTLSSNSFPCIEVLEELILYEKQFPYHQTPLLPYLVYESWKSGVPLYLLTSKKEEKPSFEELYFNEESSILFTSTDLQIPLYALEDPSKFQVFDKSGMISIVKSHYNSLSDIEINSIISPSSPKQKF